MRWFSHRRSPSPPGGAQWYRLLPHAACCVRSSYGARPSMHCQWGWLSSFSFFVPGDLGLWPLTLTFELRPDFCTMYLTAKFDRPMFSRSEVMARTNILTNWQTNKQTPLKTSTALRYATSEDKNLRRRLSSFVELRHVTGVQLLLLVINSLTGVVQLCRLRSSCIVLGTIHSDVVRRSLTAPRIHCAPRSCHLATDRASVPRPIRAGVFSLNDDDNGKVLEKKMNQGNILSGKTIERIYDTLSSFKNNLIFVLYTSRWL